MKGAAILALSSLLTAGGSPCPGDCDGDSVVNVAEIVTAVSIGLGAATASSCPGADVDGSSEITVDEIIGAVNSALLGCAGAIATPIPGLPDLSFTHVSGNSLGFSCADDLREPKLRMCVGNLGAAMAGPFSVWIEALPVWDLEGLEVGGESCLAIPLFDTAALRIDPQGEVQESNERNNVADVVLPTLTRGPGCTSTPTPTPTPTAGEAPEPSCCELHAGGCSAPPYDTLCHFIGVGYPMPYQCDTASGRCEAPPTLTPTPTFTPGVQPPDLVPAPVRVASFDVGCTRGSCLLVCVGNQGAGTSPAFGIAIGSWTARLGPLAPTDQACTIAPRITAGRLVVDPAAEVGERDETNNSVEFRVSF